MASITFHKTFTLPTLIAQDKKKIWTKIPLFILTYAILEPIWAQKQ